MTQMQSVHESLAAGRWNMFSLCFQLANVGSEVGRALKAKERGDHVTMDKAFDRGLELIDLTIADPKHRYRLKELCRLREILCDFFVGDNEYSSTTQFVDEYFLMFAVAADNERRG